MNRDTKMNLIILLSRITNHMYQHAYSIIGNKNSYCSGVALYFHYSTVDLKKLKFAIGSERE